MKRLTLALVCAALFAAVVGSAGESSTVQPNGVIYCDSSGVNNYVTGVWVTVKGGTSGWAWWGVYGYQPYTPIKNNPAANWHYGPAYGRSYKLTVGCGGSK